MYKKLWEILKSTWKVWAGVLAMYTILGFLLVAFSSRIEAVVARLQIRFPFLKNFWAVMIPMALIFAALPLITYGLRLMQDYYAWGKRPKFRDGEGFVFSLAAFRTERFRSRLLTNARQSGEVVPTRETEQCLTELALLIEKEWSLSSNDRRIFAHSRVQANALNMHSKLLLDWYIERTADCQRKLGWGDETVDGLYRLVEQLKVSLEELVGVGIGR